jgi:hypothetical protein
MDCHLDVTITDIAATQRDPSLASVSPDGQDIRVEKVYYYITNI